MSFTDSSLNGTGNFVGFNNFKELFSDQVFWICIKNVLIFTFVGIVCGNLMTIFLAELLFNFKPKHLGGFFRVLFIIPAVVPFIVIVLVWRYIIFSTNGFANSLLSVFMGDSFTPLNWYFDVKTDMFAIILTNFPWVGGTGFLIYLAGLQGISGDVYEAAKIDGCGTFRRLVKIDMPLIAPQLKYFLVMGVIGGLQNFDLQLIITGSGVGTTNSVNVPGYYLYEMAFLSDKTRFGYASAVGVILFIMTMGFAIWNFRQKKSEARL
jgi:ABC-type sugar transport system permease subunit